MAQGMWPGECRAEVERDPVQGTVSGPTWSLLLDEEGNMYSIAEDERCRVIVADERQDRQLYSGEGELPVSAG